MRTPRPLAWTLAATLLLPGLVAGISPEDAAPAPIPAGHPWPTPPGLRAPSGHEFMNATDGERLCRSF